MFSKKTPWDSEVRPTVVTRPIKSAVFLITKSSLIVSGTSKVPTFGTAIGIASDAVGFLIVTLSPVLNGWFCKKILLVSTKVW